MILGEAVGLAGLGLVLGIFAAVMLGRSVSALLYRVSPLDPVTRAAGVTLLVAVASLAAYFPARRAATIDAVRALRGHRGCAVYSDASAARASTRAARVVGP